MDLARRLVAPRFLIALIWLVFQLYIIIEPVPVLIQRPVHIFLAILAALLWAPLKGDEAWRRMADWGLLALALVGLAYYMLAFERLNDRMENVDAVTTADMVCGVITLLLLLEATRRIIGWSLLSVLIGFLAYGFVGPWMPGWLRFGGFEPELYVEILTMTGHGILGITTETSVNFVWYFIAFGAVFSATGGGQLFIDSALRAVGRQKGGAAKSAVVSSALFGTISGSAVANVVATGVFTIPLMKRSGYTPEQAGAHEAVASTGGQLMPPVMGVAAFVMAELLQVPYSQIALAGLIPAVAYYFALYMIVDLRARRSGIGTLGSEHMLSVAPFLPRLHLFAAPIVLIVLLFEMSAQMAALIATGVAFLSCYLRRDTRLGISGIVDVIEDIAKQAAQVAIPIAAIGIIIAVAIQSNLALKFSTQLIELSGGTLVGALVMVILGCIIMGMGLPTVAAYIIGAILFVPALRRLGISELSAHFFVMYYCVLSMITPPVALASYAGAGLAGANAMRTGLIAFQISFVVFLIPFGFAFDESLLWSGPMGWILLAFSSMMCATLAWAIALEGWFGGGIGWPGRVAYAAASLAIIFAPTGTPWWMAGFAAFLALGTWHLFLRPRPAPVPRAAE